MKKIILLFCFSFLLISCTQNTVTDDISSEPKIAKSLLALGDSLTAGYGLPIEQSYPSQLQAKLTSLGYTYTVRNAGIS